MRRIHPKRTERWVVGLLLTVALSGCFTEESVDPIPCADSETCYTEVGPGSVCLSNGVCTIAGEVPGDDTGLPDSGAPLPDADVSTFDADVPALDAGVDPDTAFNACDEEALVAGCVCVEGQAFECGTDTGECARGIRVCVVDPGETEGVLSDCVAATLGSACTTTDDCDGDAYCVTERVGPREALFDDCYGGTEPVCAATGCPRDCERRVCRTLMGTTPCDSAEDCEGGSCIDGFCQRWESGMVAELCNGLDDDCDGRIDNDLERQTICGACPYNTVLYQVTTSSFMCVDQYEASLPLGSDGTPAALYAASQVGVMPHTNLTFEEAERLCRAGSPLVVGEDDATGYAALFEEGFSRPIVVKQLCSTVELQSACGGVPMTASETVYPYGDTYLAGVCADGAAVAPSLSGSHDACRHSVMLGGTEVEIYDLSGNVAEWSRASDGTPAVFGGSYLDTDPAALRCDAVVGGTTLPEVAPHIGFRCCVAMQN